MCCKQITFPFQMFCYTDNHDGIRKEINIIPFVENNFDIVVYNKLFLFSPEFNSLIPDGERLYFDLDVVIKKNIDDIAIFKKGDLTLIDAEWRFKHEYGFPVFHHPFNSSCMTWSDNTPQKLWEHVKKDPEFFMTKYRWGMDSFLFYEKQNAGVNIEHFPSRKFYSYIFGVDITENSLYDPTEFSYRESKLRHITDHIPVILLNGPTTPEQYTYVFNKHYKS